jgi:hypothetical protein
MIRTPATRTIFWLAVAAAALALQISVGTPQKSRLWSAAFDAGHAPLFGLVAIAVLQLARRAGRLRPYVLALAVTLAAGAATELIQLLGPREASLRDFAWDALGAGIFLLVAFAIRERNSRGRVLALVVAVLLAIVALAPLAATAWDYVQRNAAFPHLCGFDAAWERRFVVTQDAELTITAPPGGWVRDGSGKAGRLTFLPAPYPGLAIDEPHPDWTGYDSLVVDLYSELPQPKNIALRIHDARHDQSYYDRFTRRLVVPPGPSRFAVSLDEVARAPRGRRMDLARIRCILIFAVDPPDSFSLYLDAIRLERR